MRLPTAALPRFRHLVGLVALIVPTVAWADGAVSTPTTIANLASEADVAGRLALFERWAELEMNHAHQPGVAVAVVHASGPVWQRAFGVRDVATRAPMTVDTVFRLGSVSKVFTAVAILQLRDAGRLRLDDPVAQHLPWFRYRPAQAGDPAITIRHLLTHTSGLPREAPLPYWTDRRFPDRATLTEVLPTVRALFTPDTEYQYSNLGLGLLGHVVEAAAGKPWAAVLNERIFTPLGMTQSSARWNDIDRASLTEGYLVRRADGTAPTAPATDAAGLAAAADVSSTAHDLARFVVALVPAGPATLLATTTRREMQRVHWLSPSWTSGRGLGFSVWRHGSRTLVGHGGWVAGYRSQIAFDPATGFGVLVLTNSDEAGPGRYVEQLIDFVLPAMEKAMAKTMAPPAAMVVPPAMLARYEGRYQNPWGEVQDVRVIDGALVLYDPGYPPRPSLADRLTTLRPVAEHAFRTGDADERGTPVVFEMNDEGEVARVKVGANYLFPVGCGTIGDDLQCRP